MAKKPIYNPSLILQNTPKGKSYLAKIRKMSPFERLIYWIEERHRIHCKRFRLTTSNMVTTIGNPEYFDGQPENVEHPYIDGNLVNEAPKPWTEDPILSTIFFCNPYRENDRVTAYLRDSFRDDYKDDPCVFLGTILLRMFNHIPTMRLLINANIPQQLGSSPQKRAKALDEMKKLLLIERDNKKQQIFGGAYIIIFPPGMQKIEAAYKTMMGLSATCGQMGWPGFDGSMADFFTMLTGFWGIGQFYTYQYIGDLAYTYVLEAAQDWHSWGYCGPGTARGLYRLQGITELNGVPLERRCPPPKDADDQLSELRTQVNKQLKKDKFPLVHMRDLCNCLCEYDKYNRALNNERHVKRPYGGT